MKADVAPLRIARRRWWQHPLLAPLNDAQAWDRLLAQVDPVWSLVEARARVVETVDEAPGVRSLWLKPNRCFRGFTPGQHVLLELQINGSKHRRAFSLSAAPRADGLLRLTIKRKPQGPVSTGAHALKAGDVVGLSQASGQFGPASTSAPLLLLCAGSGITPMMSWLLSLADSGSTRPITLLHSVRTVADLLFVEALRGCTARLPKLTVLTHISAQEGRLDASSLAERVPNYGQCDTLLCGPDGFMQMVEALYASAGRSQALISESFGRRAATIDPAACSHAVHAEESEHSFTVLSGQSLLDGAEAAGLSPRFGCRRGICRTCQCTKRSGTVRNLLTGQLSAPGEELIQLCISTPQSAIELAL